MGKWKLGAWSKIVTGSDVAKWLNTGLVLTRYWVQSPPSKKYQNNFKSVQRKASRVLWKNLRKIIANNLSGIRTQCRVRVTAV